MLAGLKNESLASQGLLRAGCIIRLTARYVDIDGNNAITPTDNRVTVMVVASTIGTTAHADDPARIWHLVVDLSQSRRHFIGQSSSNNHHIRLTGRGSEDNTKPILIVARGRQVHHFHSTAS
jgi:hypothetical protein